jgi:hypothetical protein
MPAKAITSLTAPQEQHMLFLFLPFKHFTKPETQTDAMGALHGLLSGRAPGAGGAPSDGRPAKGVHFFMLYILGAGQTPAAPPPFPTFQVPPPNPQTNAPRDLVAVMSIYDADFGPYISAFTSNREFATLLDLGLLANLDETGFVSPDDPTSAAGILANGGVFKNPAALVALLMRYNWADPTIPAATDPKFIKNPNPAWKYVLGATFPGMTVTSILKTPGGYPNAAELWPVAPVVINYAPSTPPS